MPGRNRIPIEHRERIFRAFEDEAEDYLLVADTLVVNRSMARGIVTQTLDGFLVSKETVVLRRWQRSKQKFGFIKRVDKG